jgi:50S ribosomal subunit-associated GTPase HflX
VQVEKVLAELDSLVKPRIEVLNKIDLLPEAGRAALLSRTNPTPNARLPHPSSALHSKGGSHSATTGAADVGLPHPSSALHSKGGSHSATTGAVDVGLPHPSSALQSKGGRGGGSASAPFAGDNGPAAVAVSALTGEGTQALLAALDRALVSDPVIEADLRVPQQEGAALAALEAGATIHARAYEGNLVLLTVSGPASLLGRMRRFHARPQPG